MEPLGGHPIRDSIANLATFSHSEAELIKILQQLDGDITARFKDKRAPREEHGPKVVSEEVVSASISPTLLYLDASVGPTNFAAWADQGAVEGSCICSVYAYLDGAA